ncbi:MAG: hypothetical protein JXA78_06820 [Anaerolineales bacterium]|nr:hypothetical protein [Anaerolineales bacterium]
MRYIALLLFLLLTALLRPPGASVRARQDAPPETATPTLADALAILSPQSDQALQGSVPVVVDAALEGLQSAELSFAYFQDPTDTWFPIQDSDQPLSNQTLAIWDTSKISDGDYSLRLVVTLKDGEQRSVLVSGLRVRNYTPIETDTPTPVTPSATLPPQDTPPPTQAPTPTQTPVPPTSTPLPRNPAEMGEQDILTSAALGALATLGLFSLGIIYQAMRAALKKNQEKL